MADAAMRLLRPQSVSTSSVSPTWLQTRRCSFSVVRSSAIFPVMLPSTAVVGRGGDFLDRHRRCWSSANGARIMVVNSLHLSLLSCCAPSTASHHNTTTPALHFTSGNTSATNADPSAGVADADEMPPPESSYALDPEGRRPRGSRCLLASVRYGRSVPLLC